MRYLFLSIQDNDNQGYINFTAKSSVTQIYIFFYIQTTINLIVNRLRIIIAELFRYSIKMHIYILSRHTSYQVVTFYSQSILVIIVHIRPEIFMTSYIYKTENEFQ